MDDLLHLIPALLRRYVCVCVCVCVCLSLYAPLAYLNHSSTSILPIDPPPAQPTETEGTFAHCTVILPHICKHVPTFLVSRQSRCIFSQDEYIGAALVRSRQKKDSHGIVAMVYSSYHSRATATAAKADCETRR